jgi:hypothetical protein
MSTLFDLLCSVPTTPMLCTDGTVGSSDGVNFLPFLNLACGILHPWDLEMSTKTC